MRDALYAAAGFTYVLTLICAWGVAIVWCIGMIANGALWVILLALVATAVLSFLTVFGVQKIASLIL